MGENIFLVGDITSAMLGAYYSLHAIWVESRRKEAESNKTSHLDDNSLGSVALKESIFLKGL